MHRLRHAVGLATLIGSLAIVPAAGAQSFREWTNLCGGLSFLTCGSVQLSVTETELSLRVQNLGGLHGSDPFGVFTWLGVYNLPALPDPGYVFGSFLGQSSPAQVGQPAPWSDAGYQDPRMLSFTAPSLSLDAEGGIASACAQGEGVAAYNLWVSGTTGCQPGVDGWVEMRFENSYGLFDVSEAQLAWYAVDAAASDYVWSACDTGGGQYAGTNCAPVPSGVIPEPATLLLLGTGLAGVGGALRRRRRESAA